MRIPINRRHLGWSGMLISGAICGHLSQPFNSPTFEASSPKYLSAEEDHSWLGEYRYQDGSQGIEWGRGTDRCPLTMVNNEGKQAELIDQAKCVSDSEAELRIGRLK